MCITLFLAVQPVVTFHCVVPLPAPPQPIGVTQLTFAHRSRALKCLLYLADTNTVESLFKKPIEKVK